MNSSLSIARSGMAAAQLALEVSAHNIANQDTAGFRRQQVRQQPQVEGGVTAQVVWAESAQGGDLATDVIQQKLALYAFKANARTVEVHDAMLGRLFDDVA